MNAAETNENAILQATIHRRAFLKSAAALAAVGLSLGITPGVQGQGSARTNPAGGKRPNIILMLVDDLGYECLGANGSKTFQSKTPQVDKLAAGGMRFDQAFVQPLCTPTRAALMTGKLNARNYVHFGLLESSQTTFGHLLRDGGYATCIVGKWQLGGSVEEETPKHFGFDEHCLYHIKGTPRERGPEAEYASRYINPGLVINSEPKRFGNNAYAPDLCNDFLLDYVKRHARQEKPVFVHYPMMLTHAPFDPTPDSSDYPGKGGPARSGFEHYQDMVAYNDKLIGKLVDQLDKLGIRQNTLLLFLGDNGTPGRFTIEMNDGTTVSSGKSETTRAGMHVPLVANWPGAIPAGKVCGDLIDVTDFLPTICEAAGIRLPGNFVTDGQSFLPQLRGEKGMPREWIYQWYCPLMDRRPNQVFEMAFTRDFKLYKTGEFYDWRTDSEEMKPLKTAELTGDAASAAARLQQVLDRYQDARPPAIQAMADALQKAAAAKSAQKGGGEKRRKRSKKTQG